MYSSTDQVVRSPLGLCTVLMHCVGRLFEDLRFFSFFFLNVYQMYQILVYLLCATVFYVHYICRTDD